MAKCKALAGSAVKGLIIILTWPDIKYDHCKRHPMIPSCFATVSLEAPILRPQHSVGRHWLVVPYSIMSIGLGADPGFLAVNPQVTLVINPVVGCRYFPPGLRLLSQPKRSSPWPITNYTAWWQRHTGVSSLPKATAQWCPTRTRTRDILIASLLPCR